MNIFALDQSIKKCARFHCDKHTVKMQVEYAQLLSSAVRLSGVDSGYKLTHQNHPCAKWVRESIQNWMWLRELEYALEDEWKFRYNHKCSHKSVDVVRSLPIPNLPNIGFTTLPMCMPEEYKISEYVIHSYREYYRKGKINILNWKNRDVPLWIHDTNKGDY